MTLTVRIQNGTVEAEMVGSSVLVVLVNVIAYVATFVRMVWRSQKESFEGSC